MCYAFIMMSADSTRDAALLEATENAAQMQTCDALVALYCALVARVRSSIGRCLGVIEGSELVLELCLPKLLPVILILSVPIVLQINFRHHPENMSEIECQMNLQMHFFFFQKLFGNGLFIGVCFCFW